MMGSTILLPLMLLLLCTPPLTTAQEVEISGTAATAGEDHTLICTLRDFDATGKTLEYVWSAGGDTLQRSTENDFLIVGVQVTNAQEYQCDVFEVPDTGEPTLVISGTQNLQVTIPPFTTAINAATTGAFYVGLNVTFSCQTTFVGTVTAVTASLEINAPEGSPGIGGAAGRIEVTDIVPLFVSGLTRFSRDLYFFPISAEDVGTYTCTGTVMPEMSNTLVTNHNSTATREISVFNPEVEVLVSAVGVARYLDIPPYNSLLLNCSTVLTIGGRTEPAFLYMSFDWQRTINASSPVSLPAQSITGGRQFGSSGSSTLSLVVTEVGSHTYSCTVTLDVSPAPDLPPETQSLTVEVIGPSLPENLTTPTQMVFHDSAVVQWHVASVNYDPENYTIYYGLSQSNLSSQSSTSSSGPDISRTNFLVSLQLTGLKVDTDYYYRVEALNSVGMAASDITSFRTFGQPPIDLRAAVDTDTPTTYSFVWTPPANAEGVVEYELSCRPSEGVAITRTFPSSVTEGSLSGLRYSTLYSCFVRLRNGATYSQPSNRVNITVLESVPETVICGMRWSNVSVMEGGNGAGGVDVAVSWEPPVSTNGVILGYRLEVVSFSGGMELDNATVNASTNTFTFNSLPLGDGVPYNVSIVAVNSAGVSTQSCFLTDFSNELAPPPVLDLNVTRSSGTTITVSWRAISLVEARGFVVYEISFMASTTGGRRRKQEVGVDCSSSPCRVPVERGGVVITGLDAGTAYTVSVQPENGEMERSQAQSITVGSVEVTSFPILPVVVGVVVGVIALAILIVACCIICICCCNRSKNREVDMRPVDVELNRDVKGRNYVNDTELPSGDQPPPLYAAAPVKERMRPIPVSQFTFHMQDMHATKGTKFEMEFGSLGVDILAAHDIAKLNKAKNRFSNILPYDFSRVKLEPIEGEENSDYINASYIDGHKQANAYIAAQGPMPNTIEDFWRMIWEHKLPTVIMLTKVNEAGKRKCEQYWPDNVGENMNYDDVTLKVSYTEIMPFADYEIRKFEVQNVSDGCTEGPLLVTQYHFLGWPDHGVPKFATSLVEFIRRVRHGYVSERPILVHCSGGVGRTGTYITLDAMLERMKELDINVYEFVRNMRAKRVHMVQTQDQYVFIHDALDELITCGETAIQAPTLRSTLNTLSTVNPKTACTGFDEQFQLLGKVSRIPTDSDLSDALQHYNERKNRYQDKVPYNTNRIRLRPTAPSGSGSEYINASFIDGYKHRNAYIATQGPLETTVEEFWRMIWEFKSKAIVMLCNTQEDEKEASYQYWPERVDGEMELGKLLVTLLSEKIGKEFIERKIEIKEHQAEGTPGQGFVVTQYHYQQWPERDRPLSSSGLLQLIKSLNNVRRHTGNKPVTVMCNDGVGRTGSFICIHAMLERVNTENILDFFQFIKSSRIHRPTLVIELEHYRFCHDTLADYLDNMEGYANFKDLS